MMGCAGKWSLVYLSWLLSLLSWLRLLYDYYDYQYVNMLRPPFYLNFSTKQFSFQILGFWGFGVNDMNEWMNAKINEWTNEWMNKMKEMKKCNEWMNEVI